MATPWNSCFLRSLLYWGSQVSKMPLVDHNLLVFNFSTVPTPPFCSHCNLQPLEVSLRLGSLVFTGLHGQPFQTGCLQEWEKYRCFMETFTIQKGLSQASSYLISFAIRLLFLPLKRVAEGTLRGPRKLADWSELFVILSCLPQWLTAARG